MKWKQTSLAPKLASVFLAVTLFMALVGYLGVTRIRRVAEAGSTLYTRVTIPQGIIADIAVHYQQMRAYTIYYIKGTDAGFMEAQRRGIDARRADLARGFRELDQADLDGGERALVVTLKGKLAKYYASQEKVFALSGRDRYAERQLVFTGDAMKIPEEIQVIVDRLFDQKIAMARRTEEENGKTARAATLFMVILVAFGVVVSTGLGILLYRADLELGQRYRELEESNGKVRILSGLLPICMSCKKIRNDEGYWDGIETYISRHSEAVFSHGICGDCLAKLYPEHAPRA